MKIKYKLPILTILISIIPIIIVSAISYTTIIRFSNENYTRIILNQSQASFKHIQDFYETQINTISYASKQQDLIQYLEAYKKQSPDLKELADRITISQKVSESTNPYLNSSTVINSDGLAISSSSEAIVGADYSNSKTFKEVLQTGKIVYDVISDGTNSKDILISAPIKNSSNTVIGALQRVLNIKYLNSYIKDLKIGDTGYMYIIDQYGDTLSHFYSDRVVLDKTNPGGIENLLNLINQSVTGELQHKNGFFDYYIGEQKIKAYYELEPYTNWLIVVAMPYNEINQVAKRSTDAIFFLSIIITLVSGFIGFLISRNIVNPLTKFQNKIELIAQGKFDERCIYNKKDEFGMLAQNINKMTESLEANEKALLSLALEDELTRMPNRKSIYLTMNTHFCKKPQQALILLDLDGFKEVNDSLGHDFGDKVLVEVATVLKQQSNENVYPARLGGDEFLVYIDHFENKDDIMALAQKILDKINNIKQIHNQTINISASLGIAFKTYETTYNQLIKKSDLAMYQVKESGKSGIKIYEEN